MNTNFDEKVFALRLSQLRESQNISARSMSLYLGHNKNYINQIEAQKFQPSFTEFVEICNFLAIEPKDFFDLETKAPADICEEIALLCRKLTPQQAEGIYHMIKEFIH